jgi:hypothetical protein
VTRPAVRFWGRRSVGQSRTVVFKNCVVLELPEAETRPELDGAKGAGRVRIPIRLFPFTRPDRGAYFEPPSHCILAEPPLVSQFERRDFLKLCPKADGSLRHPKPAGDLRTRQQRKPSPVVRTLNLIRFNRV